MRIHIVGHKGVVGRATYELFKRLGYYVTGSDKGGELDSSAEVYFICVPEDTVEEVVGIISRKVSGFIVIRSSVVPGTCKRLIKTYTQHVSHNPEFLREAVALQDEMNPARVVIGECCESCGDLLEFLYKPLRVPIIRTDPTTSELTKLASNCYLSTVISYWNEIERLAQKLGVSGHQVGMIASMDPRISPYGARLHNRYGGRCLPKDMEQLIKFSQSIGYDPVLLKAVEEVNNSL